MSPPEHDGHCRNEHKFGSIEAQLAQLQGTVGRFQKQLDELRISVAKTCNNDHEERLRNLITAAATEHESIRREIKATTDPIRKDITDLETAVYTNHKPIITWAAGFQRRSDRVLTSLFVAGLMALAALLVKAYVFFNAPGASN